MTIDITSKELKKVFTTYDTNEDGLITIDELGSALRVLGKIILQKQVYDYLESVGHKGLTVDFSILRSAYSEIKPAFEDYKPAIEAFKLLDGDSNGTILESELKKSLLSIGEPMSHQEVNCLFEDLAVNSNGGINYENLLELMTNGYPPESYLK